MENDGTAIVAIIPTYNEPEELERVVRSLLDQGQPNLHLLVVNAGGPLPESITRVVEEVTVDKDHYWTHCVAKGLEIVRSRNYDFVYLTNADTYALPGTLAGLLSVASERDKVVACAPAYIEDGGVRLLYSHQDPMGFLLYGRLTRPWSKPEDAPNEPFEIVLTGGQGVLLPASAAREFSVDTKNFPHYASDHDLWLVMRRAGWTLWLVPTTGVVNTRTLSAQRKHGIARLNMLWRRMTSDLTPESWKIMWRLRRKHLALPAAVVSTLVSFLMRWTIGLPKILRRT